MVRIGEHAVVLGASMGGLSAARALADFYETVTVVERDLLPAGVANRRGVPQGWHGHAILGKGLEVLSEFYPGFTRDLVDAGAPALDYRDLSEAYMSFAGHLIPRTGTFADVPAAFIPSRPLLESLVRERLRGIGNVALLEGYDVVSLNASSDGRRVSGIRIKAHNSDRDHVLAADVVVDATGRGARTPAFLESLGYARPPEEQVKVGVTYSSQLLRLPPGTIKEKIVLVGVVPGRPTGMALLGYENDTWMFTAFGMAGSEPPRELAEMFDFVDGLAPQHLRDALRTAEPLAEVCRFRYPESRWRRYDKMRRMPEGLLVLGDAICSFNPIYGQGMTVALLQSQALSRCLQSGSDDLARRFFRAAAKPIGIAWKFATGSDLGMPEIAGRRTLAMRLTHRYADRLQRVGESDLAVAEQFMRVVGLLDPPTALLRPRMLMRAARYRRPASIPEGSMQLSRA